MRYLNYPVSFLLILMFSILALVPARARPLAASHGPQVLQGKLDSPSREEVISEIARQTGLTNDAVSLIAKENPQLLQGLNDAVLGIKVVNSLADARDTEALADLMGYAVDKLRDKVFPSAMNGFITAFKVYKTALETTRDYYYVPKLDAGLYNAYREARADGLRRGDTSIEEITNAFERASTRDWSGYYG